MVKCEPGNIYFNKVYIIQSLNDGDRLTAKNCMKALLDGEPQSIAVLGNKLTLPFFPTSRQ